MQEVAPSKVTPLVWRGQGEPGTEHVHRNGQQRHKVGGKTQTERAVASTSSCVCTVAILRYVAHGNVARDVGNVPSKVFFS